MKNVLKAFCIAAAITVSIGACSGNGKGGSADSSKVDSSTSITTDTLVKTDTTKKDTSAMMSDTPKTKVDTMSKTVTTKKVVKKTVVTKP